MEREKASTLELPDLEMELLKLCLFTENFETLCAECTLCGDEYIIADAIKNLIHHKLLLAENRSMGHLSWVYDGDKMRESRFRATVKGLDLIG